MKHSVKILGFVLIFTLLLSSCGQVVPETLKIKGKTYQTGFYGELIPYEMKLADASTTLWNTTVTKIEHDKFDLYHADVGEFTSGTVYCEESQFDEALEYYSDPDNYVYFCDMGVETYTTSLKTVEIPNVDKQKFEELVQFATKSTYLPFDSEHNSKVETIDLPMPDYDKDICLVFYKQSTDKLFTTSTGNDFYIFDGVMYMAYQYDHGHGEYEKLIAVEVPKELSDYFVEFISSYI